MREEKIVVFKSCLECNRKCNQDDESLQVCFFYNRNTIKNMKNVLNEELKDNIKFQILWFLDNENCDIALKQSKELSKAVDKIIEEIKISIDK